MDYYVCEPIKNSILGYFHKRFDIKWECIHILFGTFVFKFYKVPKKDYAGGNFITFCLKAVYSIVQVFGWRKKVSEERTQLPP